MADEWPNVNRGPTLRFTAFVVLSCLAAFWWAWKTGRIY